MKNANEIKKESLKSRYQLMPTRKHPESLMILTQCEY